MEQGRCGEPEHQRPDTKNYFRHLELFGTRNNHNNSKTVTFIAATEDKAVVS